jgi:hypothetical protein
MLLALRELCFLPSIVVKTAEEKREKQTIFQSLKICSLLSSYQSFFNFAIIYYEIDERRQIAISFSISKSGPIKDVFSELNLHFSSELILTE